MADIPEAYCRKGDKINMAVFCYNGIEMGAIAIIAYLMGIFVHIGWVHFKKEEKTFEGGLKR